ncbi:glycosyltransferase family 2 protein [Desertivirga xinjiangensis]|uniref:glycosyltransferase family 2 protein n=1 Tax=Desertivirga xinjiangensis TaxID=539206 RepID=UPI00210BC43C|nr:glycosyltransferase family 2 protein [Pedobacter xinjiangensis]
MKIYSWIDKKNLRVCKKINIKYLLESDNNIAYALNRLFYPLYLKRLGLVILSVALFKRGTFKSLISIVLGNSSSLGSCQDSSVKYSVLKEFLWNLFGYGYFTPNGLLPILNNVDLLKKRLRLELSSRPLVSIIIPVYNQLSYTYNCLLALSNNLPKNIPYEIILVDDCSTDESYSFFSNNVIGIRYIRNEKNQGFLLNCNQAAEKSKGSYLCFLNNDTQIKKGWIEALLNYLESNPSAGLVGSKLIFPCGLLQEAGGIVYKNGATGRHGSLELTSLKSFNQLKKVDYITGASIVLRKADFSALGGFDTRYIPAYYEDTDLCMAIRYKLKKDVIYVPTSEVIHFEGMSSKKDHINQIILTNRNQFILKWKSELTLCTPKQDG